MEISEITIKLFIIFTPGIVTNIIIRQLTVHSHITPFYFTIYSFLHGLSSYLILQILHYGIHYIYCLFNHSGLTGFDSHNVLKIWSSFDREFQIPYQEVLFSLMIAVFLGILYTYMINYKVLHRWANAIHLSSKFGDDDVWSLFLSSGEILWVYVRNHKINITYYGQIYRFSEPDKARELLLANVTVYATKSGKRLYEIPFVYISGESNDISIEAIQFNKIKVDIVPNSIFSL